MHAYTHIQHLNRCAEAAAQSAYVDILHYLRQKRCKRTPVTLARVAEHGTDPQLSQVFRTGIKGDCSACAYAAKRRVTKNVFCMKDHSAGRTVLSLSWGMVCAVCSSMLVVVQELHYCVAVCSHHMLLTMLMRVCTQLHCACIGV
jgi:hypothetical protein